MGGDLYNPSALDIHITQLHHTPSLSTSPRCGGPVHLEQHPRHPRHSYNNNTNISNTPTTHPPHTHPLPSSPLLLPPHQPLLLRLPLHLPNGLTLDPQIKHVPPIPQRHHAQHGLAVPVRQPRVAREDLAVPALERPADADFLLPRSVSRGREGMVAGRKEREGKGRGRGLRSTPCSPCSGTDA